MGYYTTLIDEVNEAIGTLNEVSLFNDNITNETETITNVNPFIITGVTNSRLGDVATYDLENPYQVGINGVTEVTSDYVKYVIDEIWKMYGNRKAFKGWYISTEISRKTKGAIEIFSSLGKNCKQISAGLPVFISPWIDGKKAVMAASGILTKEDAVSLQEHEKEWNEIFDGIQHSIDAVAFQDGHIDFHELEDFFRVNKQLADRYQLKCWTNAESFDRDMPIKFLPIKFEKLKLKLDAAARAGYDKAITFEFSHFMSPQSAYPQAHHLYNRYQEYLQL
jgi:hypothetical protein